MGTKTSLGKRSCELEGEGMREREIDRGRERERERQRQRERGERESEREREREREREGCSPRSVRPWFVSPALYRSSLDITCETKFSETKL